MHHAFGGDKIVMMPDRLNNTINAASNPLAGRDNSTGKWWVCPDFENRPAGRSPPEVLRGTVSILPYRWVSAEALRNNGRYALRDT